jgi:hypothetical protein
VCTTTDTNGDDDTASDAVSEADRMRLFGSLIMSPSSSHHAALHDDHQSSDSGYGAATPQFLQPSPAATSISARASPLGGATAAIAVSPNHQEEEEEEEEEEFTAALFDQLRLDTLKLQLERQQRAAEADTEEFI